MATQRRPPRKVKLSLPYIRNPERGRGLYWDTIQKGLVLQVQPTGQRSYKCIYSFRGKARWYTIADVKAIGLKEARKLAGHVRYQVAQGKDPQGEKRAQRNEGTFAQLATRYVEEFAKRKNRSWKQGAYLVSKHVVPRLGHMHPADIKKADVKGMIARIEAPVVANQTLAATSAIFSWAIKEEIGGVMVNPCKNVERNPVTSRERILSDSELPLFWNAFDKAELQGAALKLILLLGQRPGEVLQMRTEHIIDSCWWEMPGAPDPAKGWPGTKNGHSHKLYLPVIVQEMLVELNDGFVLAGRGGRRPIARLDVVMRAICRALGVERATPHDLRRTHGTKITGLGFGRDAMNRIQNHKEGGIGSVYDRHGYADENKRVMEAVASHLMAIIEGKGDDNVVRIGERKRRR